jgi:hypothetical protein
MVLEGSPVRKSIGGNGQLALLRGSAQTTELQYF